MIRKSIDGETFQNLDFSDQPPEYSEYDQCTFQHCSFSAADLSEMKFLDCRFEQCDLSMANLSKTNFQEAQFAGCKLLGLRFDDCHDFLLSFTFENCLLNLSSFFQVQLPETTFKNCQLAEVDFTEANLQKAIFQNCDLSGATFMGTNLKGADFFSAANFIIDPERNRVKGAKFSVNGLPGLLSKYQIEIS